MQCVKKADITLQRDKLLGDFSPVKCVPQFQIDLVIELIDIRRIRNVMELAHAGKGAGGGFWKIK